MTGLALIAGLAALTWVARLPGRVTAGAVLALWLGFVALHLLAPDSAAAAMIGGEWRAWLMGGAAVALLLAYRAGLRWLRARAVAPVKRDAARPDMPAESHAPASFDAAADTPLSAPAAGGPLPDIAARSDAPHAETDGPISDAELDRYARHLVLREIGGPGQMRLRAARVLVVGAGALGAPVCLYLAAAGVGRITLADDDHVDLSNLQRQVIFRADQRGQPKVQAAAANMAALNHHVRVTPLPRRVTDGDEALIAAHDLVLDGTDSFASRQTVNRLCARQRVALIAGSIGQWEGQLTLYDPARGGPCMACLFAQPPAPGLAPSCAEAGVIGPLPGVIGSMMALEAIKHLTGAGQGMRGRMLIFDGLFGDSRMIATKARPDCAICGGDEFVTGT